MGDIGHTHPPEIAFDTDCPACTKADRARWRREYESEKARVKRLEAQLAGAVENITALQHALAEAAKTLDAAGYTCAAKYARAAHDAAEGQ